MQGVQGPAPEVEQLCFSILYSYKDIFTGLVGSPSGGTRRRRKSSSSSTPSSETPHLVPYVRNILEFLNSLMFESAHQNARLRREAMGLLEVIRRVVGDHPQCQQEINRFLSSLDSN